MTDFDLSLSVERMPFWVVSSLGRKLYEFRWSGERKRSARLGSFGLGWRIVVDALRPKTIFVISQFSPLILFLKINLYQLTRKAIEP
jgi:hypothetical protein